MNNVKHWQIKIIKLFDLDQKSLFKMNSYNVFLSGKCKKIFTTMSQNPLLDIIQENLTFKRYPFYMWND